MSRDKGVPGAYKGSVDTTHAYSYRTNIANYKKGVTEKFQVDMEDSVVKSVWQRVWTDRERVAKKMFNKNFPKNKWMDDNCETEENFTGRWIVCSYGNDKIISEYRLQTNEDSEDNVWNRYQSVVYHKVREKSM